MRKRFVHILLVVCLIFALSSSAGARASEYLNDYIVSIDAIGNGKIELVMVVDGVSKMDEIGVMEISIDEKNSSTASWHSYDVVFGMDDPDTFFAYDSYDYYGGYTFDGTPGHYYRVTLLVYARNGSGSDTGWITSGTVKCE